MKFEYRVFYEYWKFSRLMGFEPKVYRISKNYKSVV